jgi:CDP-paratose 2-epimerase
MKVLVTGSSGLIGSDAVLYYCARKNDVVGVDNNMRREFFGPKGDTLWNLQRLREQTQSFQHFNIDIRDREEIFSLFRQHSFELIIHCAAQPSHDKAGEIPLIDFEVNAGGTLNLLEATRRHCPQAVFIHMSTNKVYGDAPNELPLVEQDLRFDYKNEEDFHGVDESCRIDRCLHSLFGASKTAADIMAQEYGRYYGLNVGIFRGGCLTGPSHSGVELHGFLSYLVKVAVQGGTYTIFGYQGKQVRDNIHSADVIAAFEAFRSDPKPGEVYNIGGGRENSTSVLEAIATLEEILQRNVQHEYCPDNRVGDHICYISDLRKLQRDFPSWTITRSLKDILHELVDFESGQSQ